MNLRTVFISQLFHRLQIANHETHEIRRNGKLTVWANLTSACLDMSGVLLREFSVWWRNPESTFTVIKMNGHERALARPHWPRASGPQVWKLKTNPQTIFTAPLASCQWTAGLETGVCERPILVLVFKPAFHRREAAWGRIGGRGDVSCQTFGPPA